LNFFAFYFGGIRVDFLRFALYFGGIWLCIPLGMTFCSFVVLYIPLGTTFELLPIFFFFQHSMVHAQILHLHILGDFALVELNKKEEITNYGPIKNLSPPLERKRVP
jgi:hypothetical protein